jgi:hypothetical protein
MPELGTEAIEGSMAFVSLAMHLWQSILLLLFRRARCLISRW